MTLPDGRSNGRGDGRGADAQVGARAAAPDETPEYARDYTRIEGPLEIEGEPGVIAHRPLTPEAPPATDAEKREDGAFRRRVGGVFFTRFGMFAAALLTSIVTSRVLGRDGRGEYAAIITLPGTVGAFALLGLPSAVNYFAGRGMSVRSLSKVSLLCTVLISVPIVTILWFALPWLEQSFLSGARSQDALLRIVLIAIPAGVLTAFGGSILYGRQSTKGYNIAQVLNSVAALLVAIVVVGVLGYGVPGAVFGSVAIALAFAAGVVFLVARLAQSDRSTTPVSLGALGRYGAKTYAGSLTGYFHYRADVYLIQFVLTTASAGALGLYTIAVTMAEIVFYIPDSVATIFLPRVAGLSPEEANRALGRVSRLTMLVTLLCAIALIPAAYVAIHLILPAFTDCLPAFYAILPGTVALSAAKVTSSYLNGRGKPGRVSIATALSLVVNVACNLVLIPRYGIVGASISSVISYALAAAIGVYLASRLSGQSMRSLLLPGRAEVELVIDGSIRALRSAARGGAARARRSSPQAR